MGTFTGARSRSPREQRRRSRRLPRRRLVLHRHRRLRRSGVSRRGRSRHDEHQPLRADLQPPLCRHGKRPGRLPSQTITQPMGGPIEEGDVQRISFTADATTQTVRILLVQPDGANLDLDVYDAAGNHVGRTDGGADEITIPGASLLRIRRRRRMDRVDLRGRPDVSNRGPRQVGPGRHVLHRGDPPVARVSRERSRSPQPSWIKRPTSRKGLSNRASRSPSAMDSTASPRWPQRPAIWSTARATRLAGQVQLDLTNTSVSAGGSVSLSVTLTMPEGTPDGVYQGTIRSRARRRTGGPLTATIAVTITVDASHPPPRCSTLSRRQSPRCRRP